MALRFSGKHCAVVGATGTIGFRLAQAFAENGAVVSLLSRSVVQQRLKLEAQLSTYRQSLDDERHQELPESHQFITLDVSDAKNIRDVFSARPTTNDLKQDVVGPVDILINCAGISQTTLLKRTPDLELANILNTNLLATMLVCKYAKLRPNGCIINVSSLMAFRGGLGASAYAASKAGIVGFTRALCRELSSRPVRVNALLPGWVDSAMWRALKPELQQAYLRDTPVGRVANPSDISDAAIFLAANEFANNCILNLDGGLSAA